MVNNASMTLLELLPSGTAPAALDWAHNYVQRVARPGATRREVWRADAGHDLLFVRAMLGCAPLRARLRQASGTRTAVATMMLTHKAAHSPSNGQQRNSSRCTESSIAVCLMDPSERAPLTLFADIREAFGISTSFPACTLTA